MGAMLKQRKVRDNSIIFYKLKPKDVISYAASASSDLRGRGLRS